MQKSKWKAIIIPGMICALILFVSIWYSVRFNESRLLVKTGSETYHFSPKDLPMICAVVLTIGYILYLMIYLGRISIRQRKIILESNRTRKISPKLGFLGFFGFFYEGKMSNTFMDERFKENKNRAQLNALKIAFSLIIVELVFLSLGSDFMSPEYMLIGLHIMIALSIALALFLSEYLLYRYDHDEYADYGYRDEYSEK